MSSARRWQLRDPASTSPPSASPWRSPTTSRPHATSCKPHLALYVGGMGAKGQNYYNALVARYGYEARGGRRSRSCTSAARSCEAIAAVPDALVDEVALVGPRDRIADRLEAWSESPRDHAPDPGARPCDAPDDGRVGCCEAGRALRPLGSHGDRHRAAAAGSAARWRPGWPRRARTSSSAPASRSAARRSPPSSSASSASAPLGLRCDVRDPDEVQAVVDRTRAEFGRVDILVNNAGTSWGAAAEDHPLEGWQKVIDVNLTGVFLFAQAAGRVMIEQKAGKIVNIASVAAFGGAPPELMNARRLQRLARPASSASRATWRPSGRSTGST